MWFWSFWWLIFPMMFFAMGALQMWFRYKRHKDNIELMKIYAAQGKDPAEVARMLGMGRFGFRAYQGYQGYPGATSADPLNPTPTPPPGPDWTDPAMVWGPRFGRHLYRRWGPYRQWRRVIFFGSIALGFGLASQYSGVTEAGPAFRLVAIITGVFALGAVLSAIVASFIAADADKSSR